MNTETQEPTATPRSNTAIIESFSERSMVPWDFACTLERELTLAQSACAEIRTLAMDGHSFQMSLCTVLGIETKDESLPHQELALRKIAELLAACASKDEALKVGRAQVAAVVEHNEQVNNGEPSTADREDLRIIDEALSPDCAQPFLERLKKAEGELERLKGHRVLCPTCGSHDPRCHPWCGTKTCDDPWHAPKPQELTRIGKYEKLLTDTEQERNAALARVKTLEDTANEFRDATLNQRYQLEAPCLENDQTNAVLDLYDSTIGKALSAPSEGETEGTRIARENRAVCNNLTQEERDELTKKAFEIINQAKPAPTVAKDLADGLAVALEDCTDHLIKGYGMEGVEDLSTKTTSEECLKRCRTALAAYREATKGGEV